MILFILIAIGMVLFGYFLMSCLDSFFQKGGFNDSPPAKTEKSILYYSAKQTDQLFSRLEPMLEQHGLCFCPLSEPHVPMPAHMLAVLALSDHDLDNLLLCHEAKHLCAEVYTIALCNDQLFKHFFRDAGINQVLTENQTVDALFTLINERVLASRQ